MVSGIRVERSPSCVDVEEYNVVSVQSVNAGATV